MSKRFQASGFFPLLLHCPGIPEIIFVFCYVQHFHTFNGMYKFQRKSIRIRKHLDSHGIFDYFLRFGRNKTLVFAYWNVLLTNSPLDVDCKICQLEACKTTRSANGIFDVRLMKRFYVSRHTLFASQRFVRTGKFSIFNQSFLSVSRWSYKFSSTRHTEQIQRNFANDSN